MSEHAVAPKVARRPGPRRPVLSQYLRRSSRALGSAVARIRPAGPAAAVPALARGPWDAPGSLTAGPAGWFTVAVEAGRDGFCLDGRTLDAAALAAAIWRSPRWRGRPVLLVTQPGAPQDGAGPMLRQLAEDLGAPVYASDRGLHFVFGRAVADRMFWCWRPGSDSDLPEAAGAVLPPPASAPARASCAPSAPAATPVPGAAPAPFPVPAAGGAPEPDTGPEIRSLVVPAVRVAGLDLGIRPVALEPAAFAGLDLRSHRPSGAAEPAPEAAPAPADAVAGSAGGAGGATRAEPAWYPVGDGIHETDREQVRGALGWKFQAYSRVVTRATSLHPGLRGAAGAHDGGLGLVAVLALLDGAGTRVNEALRGGGVPDEQARALARCAAAGLAQLPAVNGPVFAAAPDDADLTRLYRPGDVLVEPAFTTVSVGRGGGAAPRYAIWSASARRLDQLRAPDDQPGESQALFAAGTRFEVLAVDPAGPGGAPCVLLRERVPGRHDGGLDQRVAGKLRDALAGRAATAVTQPWPLGLAGGLRFPLDADARGRGRPAPTSAPEGAAS
ncbi:hypothetical protein [Dactylosporangium sp. CA-092794]|uniref:hypothetical protein n=1 Tax=Dactylosporangium sp. CA-092794 TaxID=3239929 RepID=UPI003D8AA7DF